MLFQGGKWLEATGWMIEGVDADAVFQFAYYGTMLCGEEDGQSPD